MSDDVRYHDVMDWQKLLKLTDVRKLFFEKHLILDIQTTFRVQKFYCKNFRWKYIKNERCKSHLGNKEQKAIFLVVSRSDVYFGILRARIFYCKPDPAR